MSPESKYTVELATEADVAALYQLIQAAFLPCAVRLPSRPTALAMSESDLLATLACPGGTFLVRCEREVIATGAWLKDERGGWLKRIAVHPAYQGTGVGRRIVKALEGHARAAGVRDIRLGTRRSLPGNLLFYSRLGYVERGREPYPDGIDDEVVWMGKGI